MSVWDYHGLTIVNNRKKRSHSHIDALVKSKIPNTKKELQSFLGSCNYLSKFLKNFAHTAAPLYKRLKDNVSWNRDNSCNETFSALINLIKNTFDWQTKHSHPIQTIY
ncbi:hypothetical protein RF11_16468 [Thelohanellus kitauei]|uniref:Uncharacterized protein n=1 Tax=Thelohanellus kitauei TaxID=669202 RepID=A0A0C2MN55_THEKT|nr:hypothetical protein RF11_16468 [Thelohanellus kitauei]